MKRQIKYIATLLFLIVFSWDANAQDNRTLNTKVIDILAQMPVNDMNHSNRLMEEILELGNEGISNFTDMIVPPGTGDDTQARYALESLARYSGSPKHESVRTTVEQAFLNALEKATDKEVKAFIIRRLIYCGSNTSVDILEKYLKDDKLYSPALMILTSIGTDEAGQVILANLPSLKEEAQIHSIKALGEINYVKAEKTLIKYVSNANQEIKRQSLYALASLAQPTSKETIAGAAEAVNFMNDETDAMVAYIHYAQELALNGNKELSSKLCSDLLKKCKAPEQLHFRSSAVTVLRVNKGTAITSLLIKEFKNTDKAYANSILNAAKQNITSAEIEKWIRTMKKVSPEKKAQILSMLAKQDGSEVLQECIVPALTDESREVRIEAMQALAINQKDKAIPYLLDRLDSSASSEELLALKNALLITCGIDECSLLAKKMNTANSNGKVILIEVISARRATDYFDLLLSNCQTDNESVNSMAYASLKNVAKSENLNQLLVLLEKTSEPTRISNVQNAIIEVLNTGEETAKIVLTAFEKSNDKTKLIPVFPYLKNKNSLKVVTTLIENGSSAEKESAFEALANWKNQDAIPGIFNLISNKSFHDKAFQAYLKQVMSSDYPADQKLLLVKKLMPETKTNDEKEEVLQATGNIKTFLSLVYVSKYIDDEQLSSEAASAAMKIFLPTPGKEDGLTGSFVKEVAKKVQANLKGQDSQYHKIDIQEYLDKLPEEEGFVSIFNGKDLTGWQGLVKNPIEREKMTAKQLAKEQKIANQKMLENWSVKNGSIVFNGNGDNLCTIKKYKDFELLADWRITKKGDSGFYLRGTPQVQIWDTSRVEVGAQVGSGGLYNNQVNESKPLVVADNAIGEWNTFRIKMIGEKVTVYLNGILVVDNVTMENYWDRSMPIFPEEAIELQAHGTDLAFRNLYVREIDGGDTQLTDEEKKEGFTSLFNGKDLDYWVGNKTDYLVKDGIIAVRPKQGGHGNLYTAQEYSDFIFRFEFQLTPGANNGLGIHAPLEGDAAYVGKELQILDNTAAVYANLQPYQYHGSVYGIIPAKRGFLKPVGEWNYQEVYVKGDDIKITLNGNIIVDGNIKEATKNGTADHKDHPGLKRHKGHIGFLGHGSELQFRNIRIKDLSNEKQ